ncbi:MAG: FmdB family zinc ribbon protein [Acidimicrobiia bacterium]
MPTYVYECAKCNDEFEIWQSIKDDPLKRHTGGCGGKLVKVIQPAGIVLKGSGFYKNDSRGSSKRSTVSGNGDAKSGESKSGESKSGDSKSSDSNSGESKSSDSGSSDSSGGSTDKKSDSSSKSSKSEKSSTSKT